MIIVETAQLRGGAEALQQTADIVEELARVVAYDVTGLPPALGAWSGDALAAVTAELRAMGRDLRLEGSLLAERAVSVESEQTQASAASGPGLGTSFVVNAGSNSSILPEFVVTPGAGPGLATPYDAEIEAGADRMAAGILGAMGGGGAAGAIGGLSIFDAMDSGPSAIVGSGRNVYEGPMGTRSTDYPSNHDGEVPTDGLAIGD